jgi:RHS repeat-associated protein
LGDAQGSTRALTDDLGAITSNYDYDAFGNLQGTPTLETNYLYTGQQYDAISELYSLRARYYDPEYGRFLTRDIWAYDYGNPVELNRYVYAANNPATWSDPSGHNAEGYGKLSFGALLARQAGGAAVGAIVGGSVGGISAVPMWALMSTGACGDVDISFEDYVWASARIGAAFGAFIGSLPPGAAMTAFMWSSRAGMLLSFLDITANGLNACNLIGFVAGYTGGSSTFTFTTPNLGISFSNNGTLAVVGVITGDYSVITAGTAGALFLPPFYATENQNDDNGDNGGGSSDDLKPYEDEGGHHIHQQAAFRDDPKYSKGDAPALPADILNRDYIHQEMTNKQRELYKELANDIASGTRQNTLAEHTKIAYEALIAGGVTADKAQAYVNYSEQWLIKRGVTIFRIPWSGGQ